MDLRFAREADAHLALRRAWWRENCQEARIFDDELAEATKRLTSMPATFPVFAVRRGRTNVPPGGF